MTNQTNTSGGASVGGNVDAQGDFVGRDKNTINNIIIKEWVEAFKVKYPLCRTAQEAYNYTF